MSEPILFVTVGQLRNALSSLPDHQVVVCQVASEDGSAWNLYGEFMANLPNANISVLTLRHPQLRQLKDESWQT